MFYKEGLSSSQFYKTLYEQQQGKCAICGDWYEKLFIDHDHTTGKVRKLLCPTCNFGLGSFKDNENILQKAFRYLADWRINSQTIDLLEKANHIEHPKHTKVPHKTVSNEDLLAYLASNAGASQTQVAEHFGVTRQAIGPRIKKLYEYEPVMKGKE